MSKQISDAREIATLRVLGVKYVAAYTLNLHWANSRTSSADLHESVFKFKGLRALRDEAYFALVKVGEGGHSIVWPDGEDIGADQLWERSLEQCGRIDTVTFVRWRRRNALSLAATAEALDISRRQVAYYSSGECEVPRLVLLACAGWEVEQTSS